MTDRLLSNYFDLHRRYFRSVNLERDLDIADAVLGYVPTERSIEALGRITSAFGNLQAHRYWTLTGVYGTGKSAFAHFLACLCAPKASVISQQAFEIVERTFGKDNTDLLAIKNRIPACGLFRAIATARREPLSWTIVRAIDRGAQMFWDGGKRPKIVKELSDLVAKIDNNEEQVEISPSLVLSLLKNTAKAIDADLLLVIDELGKSLEFASHQADTEDLYLLQQIAEMKNDGKTKIYFLGLLHQSFAGYSDGLTTVERNEWMKVQGRFEDIPFTESPDRMTRLIGQAIDRTAADPILVAIDSQSQAWLDALKPILNEYEISKSLIATIYPLHPLTALLLPLLCVRYAQNDRSLFTFLTSDEPFGFRQFLESETINGDRIPTLKLDRVYDYFVESMSGLTSRVNLQRWVEIQSLIQDAGSQPFEVLRLLKTIGIMNLVTATGALRASPELVALALCERADDAEALAFWHQQIDRLKARGTITYRRQGNELRIWEGSEFNVDEALQNRLESDRSALATLLQQLRPLPPLVAQRHYATTGSLRYFDRQYADFDTLDLDRIVCASNNYDGAIVYWVDAATPKHIPAHTQDGKPLIVVEIDRPLILQTRIREFNALAKIQATAPELLTDGVARKEVKYRLQEAERLLDETIARSFDWAINNNTCYALAKRVEIDRHRALQSLLSDLCDRTYDRGLKLDNELINRQELTAQGATAQRKLIAAAIEFSHLPQLNLEGYGPETSMYHSVFRATGIHRRALNTGEEWGFCPPDLETSGGKGIAEVWQAVEDFCLGAIESQRSLDLLYQELANPPYGVRSAIVPLIIVAVLIYRVDDLSLYKDGVFVPILSAEHFELLVRDPSRYSVKYIEVVGLRAEVFKELESILRSPDRTPSISERNATLLSVVKPLFQFEKRLPNYTKTTTKMSDRARAVLQSFQAAKEPDVLIFNALPIACELPPITADAAADTDTDLPRELRTRLVRALQEIQNTYEQLLIECKSLLHSAFGVREAAENLREDLRIRSSYLVGNCTNPILKGFTNAAVEETKPDREWLEALITIVADKSPKSWNDSDVTNFDVKLSDLVRRFQNLEALQRDTSNAPINSVAASRITVTQADGREVNRTIWIDRAADDKIDRVVDELVAKINTYDDINLRQAIVARLTERILGGNNEASMPAYRSQKIDRRSRSIENMGRGNS